MTKIIMIIAGLIITIPTYATTMCAANETVAIILDPSIAKIDMGADATSQTWWAQLPFGRVSGTAALINKNCTQGKATSELTDIDNNGDTKRIVGGEKYGKVCWCKLIHPAMSKWVCNVYSDYYNDTFGFDRGSFAHCVGMCTILFGSINSGLFGSIEN